MVEKLGYRIPFVLLLVLGIFFAVQYYIPHPYVQQPKELILQWKQPLNAFIIFTAIFGLISLHIRKIMRRDERWGYSIVTLTSMAAMIIAGIFGGVNDGSVFSDWFKYLVTPIESTMFALLAFFIASAAFRAFKARTVGAVILLISATIVMLGLIPIVEESVPLVTNIAEFLLKYPNTAAKRAILIGVALGAISVSIRTIFGIDKTILGRDK